MNRELALEFWANNPSLALTICNMVDDLGLKTLVSGDYATQSVDGDTYTINGGFSSLHWNLEAIFGVPAEDADEAWKIISGFGDVLVDDRRLNRAHAKAFVKPVAKIFAETPGNMTMEITWIVTVIEK